MNWVGPSVHYSLQLISASSFLEPSNAALNNSLACGTIRMEGGESSGRKYCILICSFVRFFCHKSTPLLL